MSKCSMKHCENEVKFVGGKPKLCCEVCEEEYGKTVNTVNNGHYTFGRVATKMVDRARSRGKFPVEITPADVLAVWPKDNTCPLIGELFVTTNMKDGNCRQTTPSLDRIDPTKGYVLGNIQVISTLANRLKTDATDKQLETFCVRMLEMLEEKRLENVL